MRNNQKALTSLKIPSADGPDEALSDFSGRFNNAESIAVVFRDHKRHLIEFISRYDFIVGAVAWFTDEEVIGALRNRYVSIIVQKEDFLKPDHRGSASSLRRAYASIEAKLNRFGVPGIASALSYSSAPQIESFRCVGNYNKTGAPAFPRMHNKFLVGGSVEVTEHEPHLFKPEAVWTGSYNISYNAQMSFENALVVYDQRVANAYINEWSQILALSEKLDWEVDWVAPDYRIGS